MRSRVVLMLLGLAVLLGLLAVWPHLLAAAEVDWGQRLEGQVCDARGRPLDSAAVTLLMPRPGGDVVLARTWTDPQGWFTMAAKTTKARGPFELKAAAGGFAAERQPVASTGHHFRLDATGAIEGRVLDGDDHPVASVRLSAVATGAPALAVTAWSRWDGSFRLRVPRGRSFRVEGRTAEGTPTGTRVGARAGRAPLELRLR